MFDALKKWLGPAPTDPNPAPAIFWPEAGRSTSNDRIRTSRGYVYLEHVYAYIQWQLDRHGVEGITPQDLYPRSLVHETGPNSLRCLLDSWCVQHDNHDAAWDIILDPRVVAYKDTLRHNEPSPYLIAATEAAHKAWADANADTVSIDIKDVPKEIHRIVSILQGLRWYDVPYFCVTRRPEDLKQMTELINHLKWISEGCLMDFRDELGERRLYGRRVLIPATYSLEYFGCAAGSHR